LTLLYHERKQLTRTARPVPRAIRKVGERPWRAAALVAPALLWRRHSCGAGTPVAPALLWRRHSCGAGTPVAPPPPPPPPPSRGGKNLCNLQVCQVTMQSAVGRSAAYSFGSHWV
jgi:hypothetical protein